MAKLTWQEAISLVLDEHDQPMHVQEITDRILELDLRDNYGATPRNTVGAQLAQSVKYDAESPFVKVGKATYTVKERLVSITREQYLDRGEAESDDTSVELEEGGFVHAFGMYWQRDAVHWSSLPALLGRQQIGAESVDFTQQLGVYLLHDGREVVYVGRSTERPMGRRLYEHTQDRLQTRWNRFSWFGLLKVTETGSLVEAQAVLTPELVAVSLEAVLIEGLEPRQNRRRGDGFNATEYLQVEDPEIERKRKLALFDSLRDEV